MTVTVKDLVDVTIDGNWIDQRVMVRVGVIVVVPRTELKDVGVGASTVRVVVDVAKAVAVAGIFC